MNNELLKLFDIKDDVVETFTVDHKESNYEIDIRFKPSRFSCPTCDLLYLYLLMINL